MYYVKRQSKFQDGGLSHFQCFFLFFLTLPLVINLYPVVSSQYTVLSIQKPEVSIQKSAVSCKPFVARFQKPVLKCQYSY